MPKSDSNQLTEPIKIAAKELPAVLKQAADEGWEDLYFIHIDWRLPEKDLKIYQHIYIILSFDSLDFSALSGVKSLVMFFCHGLRVGEKPIPILCQLANLSSLDLGNNGIGDKGAAKIAKLQNLTSLNLGYNNIGAEGAVQIAKLQNLTSLVLRNCRIGDKGVEKIAKLQYLTSLDLGNNNIGAEGTVQIAKLQNLTSLDLRYNSIGDGGAARIANLRKLTTLDLRNNSIGDEGAVQIAKLQNLTSLDLGYNEIKDAGGRTLLEKADKYTILNLNGNIISPELIPQGVLESCNGKTIHAAYQKHKKHN
jgi:Leucine-rich repeat (LRR) protein